MLAVKLAKTDRVFLIVRGPAPSCQIAGYIPLRGRKGLNKVAFAGRVYGRRLDPGVYLISVSPNRRLVAAAPAEHVRVVSPRRSLAVPDSIRKPSCSEALSLRADPVARILRSEAARSTATLAGAPMAAAVLPVQGASASGDPIGDSAAGLVADGGVLGVATADEGATPVATVAILTFVGALLLAMLALVTRFLRGSWNP